MRTTDGLRQEDDDSEPKRLYKPPLRPSVLLIDREAEKGLMACMAEIIRPPEIDPAHITSDMIRVLFLTACALIDNGLLLFPSNYSNAGECMRVARANAEIIAHNVDLAGIWPGADGPRWTLHQCLQISSLPWLAEHYASRIKMAARRRQMLEGAEEMQRRALAPGPIEMEAS